MSALRESDPDPVILIGLSDVHLSDKAPVFRSPEPSWEEAMRRPLDEVKSLSEKYDVPVVIAGDLFHKHNPAPRLINFAIDHLPVCYAVPGNHDLPSHRYDDVRGSAYWTLVQAGRILDLRPGEPRPIEGCVLHAFPHGHDPEPVTGYPLLDGFHVAVVHAYVWADSSTGFPGALQESHLGSFRKRLGGFRLALVGDNHKSFLSHPGENSGGCTVVNCGGFMRRNSDQRDYRPRVALVRRSGKVNLHYLDVSQDRCLAEVPHKEEEENPQADFSEFLSQLSGLQTRTADWKEMVYRTARAVSATPGVMAAVRKVLGD